MINNHDCSKAMILALQEVGRKRTASRCESLMMGLKNEQNQEEEDEGELEMGKRRKFYQKKANLDITLKLATKSFLILLMLTCLNVGCFGINKVASSSSPTNIEQSFTDSNKLLLLSNQQQPNQQQVSQLQQQQLSLQHQQQPQNHLQDQQTPVSNFDASNYGSIYEAIRNHPELREVSNVE